MELYGPGLDPKCRVFGEWEAAFGCGAKGGFGAGECGGGGGGLGMNVGFDARENSGNCGAGPAEKMSFMELLDLAESGAPIPAGATPAKKKHSGSIPDDNGISVPATPMEKEQVLRKKKVKTPRQQKVKRKKHRPKIFDESKPRRVPKSTTPKRETGKRKYARRSSTGQPPGSATRSGVDLEIPTLNPQTPGPLVERRKRKCTPKAPKHPLKSCKRGINFDFDFEEDDTDVETVSTSAEEQGNQDSDCSIEFFANSSQYVNHKATESDVECTGNSSMHSLPLKLENNKTANIYDTNVISAENNLYEKRMSVGNNSVIALVGSLDNMGKQTVDCAEQEQTKTETLNYLGLCVKPEQSSPNQNASKEIMGVMNHNWGQRNSLQVYQRTFRENEIIKNSRKLGPNCPSFAKKKRTKRKRANEYDLWFLEKDSEQKVIAPNYALHSNFNNTILSVLPKSQIEAAIADRKSFKCLFNLVPIVKFKRKRSKRFPQSKSSHSAAVAHSNMGKKSSNVKFLLHALDSFPLVIAKGKRSKTLMRRQGLPSSTNTITHNSPNNLKLEAPAEILKLEAPPEIPAYPPQLVRVQPHGYDSFMEKDKRLLDTFIPTIIPTATESSHANVELRLHPQHPRKRTSPQHPRKRTSPQHPRKSTSPHHPRTSQSTSDRTLCHQIVAAHPPLPPPGVSLSEYLWSSHSKFRVKNHQLCIAGSNSKVELQKYLLPTAESTSGLKSKFKVEKRHPRHGTTMSKTNRMLSDIEFCRRSSVGSQDQPTKHSMESIIQDLARLQLSDEHGQLVVRDTNLHGAVIPYKDKFNTLKRRKMPKVYLDPETIRRWNLLMENDASELPEDEDEKKKKDWEEQREVFLKRLDVFVKCMHLLQGDRRFSPWKGSVVDSVVGVFLTQNVSDYLSSNAFMSLAAKFPVPSRSCDIQVDSPCSQESTSNTGPNRQQSHETFISSVEKELGSLQDERVVEHPPVNHDFSCSPDFSETMRLVEEVELPSCQTGNSETMPLPEEVELPGCQTVNSETMCIPEEVELPSSQTGNSETMRLLEEVELVELPSSQTANSETMRLPEDVELPSCQTGDSETMRLPEEVELPSCQTGNSETMHLEEVELVELPSFSLSGSNNPIHSTSSFDVNLGFGCDCGSKSGCACACVRGMLEEVAKASANSNTSLNELEVAMEDNTVLLNNTLLEQNTSSRSREKKGKVTKMPKPDVDWEELRRTYYSSNRTPGRNLDSIDWEAVRCAPVGEIAKVIETRGMNNVLAAKIKAFLNRLVEDHGSIDLEWLKDVPPEKAKEFLLSIRGVGLKSTECVRLLTLCHHAFPVDTNIARIVVRLGWVPLETLPGDLQIHLLEQYPLMDSIQKYLWPRLCTLDKDTLYELHYQLITFGKVICTKKNPNCNACPMRAECRHFASAFASSRLRLRGAPEKRVVTSQNVRVYGMSNSHVKQPGLPYIERDIEDFPYRFKNKDDISQDQVGMSNSHTKQPVLPHIDRDIEDFSFGFKDKDDKCYTQNSAPAIEILAPQEAEPIGALVGDIEHFLYQLDNKDEKSYTQTCEPIIEVPASPEPIIEVPASPEPESTVSLESDTNNIHDEDDDEEIPHIKLNTEEFKRNLLNFLNPEIEDEEVSNALVALTPKATTIPAPKIKSVERLRTRHRVYILPDSHPLLTGFERREHDDPCPYLLAIWLKESESLNQKESNRDCNAFQETNEQTVCGTILIPCRTANKGSFPLNGTYFQVNEVFADHESSECPINVPRKWIWNLAQRNLYCGSTASAIARGMEMDEIQQCFWNGFVCVRAFDRETRNPIHLSKRFHELPSMVGKK